MTPAQIETAARRKYNAASSSFYSSAEIYDLIYQAELEIAVQTKMLEGVTTTTSTLGTKNYAYPSGVLEVKRVEYNGRRLDPIDFRDDDAMTVFNSNNTAQGTPLNYYNWDNTLYLRPIPDASAVQIRIYYYKEPVIVTSASQTLEVPSVFHLCIVDYVTGYLALKDENQATFDRYMQIWNEKHIPRMLAWTRKRRSGDSFKIVKNESSVSGSGSR